MNPLRKHMHLVSGSLVSQTCALIQSDIRFHIGVVEK